MKTIGILGGISWTSTASYYRLLNEGVAKKAGGLHSAKIEMHSFDFDEIEKRQSSGRWDELGVMLGEAAKGLKCAGADFLLYIVQDIVQFAVFALFAQGCQSDSQRQTGLDHDRQILQ